MGAAPRRRGQGDAYSSAFQLYRLARRRREDVTLTLSYKNGQETFDLSGVRREVPTSRVCDLRRVASGQQPSSQQPSSQQQSTSKQRRRERRAADPAVMRKAAAHSAAEQAAAGAPPPILRPVTAGAAGLGPARVAAEEAIATGQSTEPGRDVRAASYHVLAGVASRQLVMLVPPLAAPPMPTFGATPPASLRLRTRRGGRLALVQLDGAASPATGDSRLHSPPRMACADSTGGVFGRPAATTGEEDVEEDLFGCNICGYEAPYNLAILVHKENVHDIPMPLVLPMF